MKKSPVSAIYKGLIAFILLLNFSAQAQYCNPTYGTVCNSASTNDIIENFFTTGGITNISNLGTGCNFQPNNYIYYSSMSVTQVPGGTFNISVQCGATYQQGFAIWVDWNNDFIYAAGEQVFNSVTGGFAPFTGTVTVPLGTSCGTYRMRVRSNYVSPPTDPCASQTFGEVEEYNVIVPGTAPVLTTSATPANCGASDGTATVNPSGLIYLWSPGGQTTQTITGLAGGTYTVTANAGPGCPSSTATVTVPNTSLPTVTSNSPTICEGSFASLTATGSPSGGTYSWAPGGATGATISVNPIVTTTYTVTYTNLGCTATSTSTVTVNPAPFVDAGFGAGICSGDNIQLGGSGSGSYMWSPAATVSDPTLADPIVNPTVTTT
ncbi:MAG: GEVED domain-containing protein, partial [Bacteroidota bacterium]|nr:GEVED domain-containing protein [Bacteroidota bacterium]